MTPARARRTTALAVAATVVALAGAACQVGPVAKAGGTGQQGATTASSDPSTSSGASTSADPAATAPPSPDLATFYSQKLDWQSCRDGGDECAKLTVPLDYHDPTGRTIQLAVLKVPAEKPSERVGSLVVDPGGPGGSAQDYAAGGSDVWGAALRDHFDIIGMDPRGVGESDPINCLSDAQEGDYLAADPDPDTPAEVQTYEQEAVAFGAGCVKDDPDLAAHVSTIEVAMDMDVLRAALGESTLTYFGASYGTKIGATYAEWFPTKVGRLVLDGAVDPAQDLEASYLSQAGGFQTALRAYVQHCVDGGSCFLGDSVDAGLATIASLLVALDQKPITTRDSDRPLTEGLAYYGIIAALYNRDYWTYLDQGLKSALGGDGSILEVLADAYAERNQDGTYANLLEANLAVNCLDDPSFVPAAKIPAEFPGFEAASSTFGKIFAWGLMSCEGYTARSDQTVRPIVGKGAAPIVVIGTTRDPATPYQQAVDLAKELDSGVLVSRDGDGHTAYHSGNQCIDSAVEDYLVQGTVPKNGLSC